MFELKKYTSLKSITKLLDKGVISSTDTSIREYVEQLYSIGERMPVAFRCLNPSVVIKITHKNGDKEEILGVMKSNSIKIVSVYINGLKVK